MPDVGFIQAILADPGDVTTRLVYADWLEDQGDPRAGAIRLAIRLRAGYGPTRHNHSPAFWPKLGEGIEPSCWVDEILR